MAPSWFYRPLARGDSGQDVVVVQRRLGARVTGIIDVDTEMRIRGLQKHTGLPITGMVDEMTAKRVGERARKGLAPEWFKRDLELWFEGEDVRAAREAFGLGCADDRFDPDLEAAVRRWQSERGLSPDGRITKDVAIETARD